MTTNALDHLQEKWTACHKEKETLRKELKQLQDKLNDLAEFERRQKIAVDNAYADGYRAGLEDATKRQK